MSGCETCRHAVCDKKPRTTALLHPASCIYNTVGGPPKTFHSCPAVQRWTLMLPVAWAEKSGMGHRKIRVPTLSRFEATV